MRLSNESEEVWDILGTITDCTIEESDTYEEIVDFYLYDDPPETFRKRKIGDLVKKAQCCGDTKRARINNMSKVTKEETTNTVVDSMELEIIESGVNYQYHEKLDLIMKHDNIMIKE